MVDAANLETICSRLSNDDSQLKPTYTVLSACQDARIYANDARNI